MMVLVLLTSSIGDTINHNKSLGKPASCVICKNYGTIPDLPYF